MTRTGSRRGGREPVERPGPRARVLEQRRVVRPVDHRADQHAPAAAFAPSVKLRCRTPNASNAVTFAAVPNGLRAALSTPDWSCRRRSPTTCASVTSAPGTPARSSLTRS
ncbi:hypothetical protein [Actinosynnema sp. NPDC023587]|uniref:hypothetical protein n=1 Tax=Actinosynnema sp. NPDC023587 TaxID=3154695 RepID=UPI0033C6FA35